MNKILGGLVAVSLVGAAALATTTSAEARWAVAGVARVVGVGELEPSPRAR